MTYQLIKEIFKTKGSVDDLGNKTLNISFILNDKNYFKIYKAETFRKLIKMIKEDLVLGQKVIDLELELENLEFYCVLKRYFDYQIDSKMKYLKNKLSNGEFGVVLHACNMLFEKNNNKWFNGKEEFSLAIV